MKLVSDWTSAWKWWSVWGGVVVAVLGAVQVALPDFRDVLPAHAFAWATLALGIAIPVLRVVQQPSKVM